MNEEEGSTEGLKYQILAEQFGEDFSGNRNITSREISGWGRTKGVERPGGMDEIDDGGYARHIVRLLRSACVNGQLGEQAYRIASKGHHLWRKEMITMNTLETLAHETVSKACRAIMNGERRGAKAGSVLLQAPQSPRERAIIEFLEPRLYHKLMRAISETQDDHLTLRKAMNLGLGQEEQGILGDIERES